jgi:hypothetical protein
MKKYTIVAVLILLTGFLIDCLGQEKPSTIALQAQWKEGDHFSYAIKKSWMTWEKEPVEDSILYSAKFEVVGKTRESYLIRWTTAPIALFSNLNQREGLPSLLQKYTKSLSLFYTTNPKGTFDRFENISEVLDWIKALPIDKLSKEEKIHLQDILENPEEYLQATLSEIAYFHRLMGFTFIPNQSLEYTKEISEPFTQDLHEVSGSFYIDYIDYEYKICNIVEELSLDQFTQGLILEALQAPMDNSSYSYFEDNYYEMMYTLGIPLSIEVIHVSKLDFGGSLSKKTEAIYVHLIDDIEFQK